MPANDGRSAVTPTTTPLGDRDQVDHPLHRVYRIRLRAVRRRWLLMGLFFGAVYGIGLFLLFMIFLYKPIPNVVQKSSGPPDVVVNITEDYINRQAAARVGQGYQTGVGGLTVVGLAINMAPNNRLDLQAVFHIDLPLFQLDLSTSVKNQITAQNGQLVLNMVGDPQLGSLTIPISLLPSNINDLIKQAVDKVNTDIIATELSRPFQSSDTAGLSIDSVSTDENSLTIRLRQK